jgi:serine/threonine protein kinase
MFQSKCGQRVGLHGSVLGIVLYQMATGGLPFQGASTGLITEAILNRNPVAPVRVNPNIPLSLQDVIHRALEKDRNLRYQHAADMRAELQRLKRDTESGRKVSEQAEWVLTPTTSRLSSIGKRTGQTSAVKTAAPRPPRVSKIIGSLAFAFENASGDLEQNTQTIAGVSSIFWRRYRNCE